MSTKVSLFYAWGSTNAGDHALTLGAISLIKKVDPEAAITVVTRYGVDEPEHQVTEKKLESFDSKLSICPSPFGGTTKARRVIGGAMQFGLSIIAPWLSRFFFRNNAAYQAMTQCDWALQNGGNLYYWNEHRKSFSRLGAFALPLQIARSAGKKIGFLPQTIGTFEGGTGKRIANFIGSADLVMYRDSSSRSNLTSVVDEVTTQALAPDLVYFLNSDETEEDVHLPTPDKEFIAMTLRDESLGDYGIADYEDDRKAVRARILDLFPEALSKVREEFDFEVVIVVQVLRDEEISRQLCERLNELGIKASVTVCFDPVALIQFYSKASILVAQRLHSQIFALNAGTPSVGLWRQRLGTKIPSMMSDLGCEDFCLNFDTTNSESVTNAIVKLLQNRDSVSEQCCGLLEQRKEEAIVFLKNEMLGVKNS